MDKGKSVNKEKYEELCKQASEREQVATDAERSSIKYKMAEYMQERIGEEYEGTISGITEWGMYVEVEPTKIEGMVMLRNIKEDYFIYDEETFALYGKSTRKRFTLGDRVKIKVARVNLEQKLIDYELIWDPAWNKKSRGESSTKGSIKSRAKSKSTAKHSRSNNR